MTHQISLTFTGHELALMLSTLGQRLSRADSVTCNEAGGNVVTGPPGPILDRLAVSDVAITGSRAVVKGQVRVIDWQSGVSHTPAPGGGRLVNWSRVPGLLDSTISLNKGDDGRWRVTGFTWAFAPGHGP